MDYEEKYKQAFERAKERYSACSAPALLEYIFPELKENEDERIRKAIICGMNALKENQKKKTFADIPLDECIAWLEKQGEQTHAKHGQPEVTKTSDQELEPKFRPGDWLCENEPNNYARFIQILEIVNVQGKGRYRISRDIHNDEDTVKFNFVEKYYHKFDIKDAKDGDVLASELSGSIFLFRGIKDNKIDFYCDYDTELEWPEHRFGINDTDQHYGNVEESQDIHPATKEQRDLLFAEMKEADYEWDNEKKELNKNDQTSADKNESKFNVGNWYQCTKDFFGKGVTFDKNTAYYCAQEGCLQNEYGCHIAIVKDLYDNFKLWSIEDARDGDVLSINWREGDDSWEKIIIFKKYHNKGVKGLYYLPCVEGYGNTFKNGKLAFQEDVPYYSKTWTCNLHPATKKQRDLLFQKMADAGYEWVNGHVTRF